MSSTARIQAHHTSTIETWVHWVRGRLLALAEGQEADRAPPPHPTAELQLIAERLALTHEDVLVLAFCAAAAVDTGIPLLCARVSGDPTRPWPSFAIAFRLFAEVRWSVLSADGGLRYWRLIELHQSAVEPLVSAALRADEHIVDLLMGAKGPDERVTSVLRPATASGGLTPTLRAASDDIVEYLQRTSLSPEGATVIALGGPDGAGKLAAAAHAVGALWRMPGLALDTLGAGAAEFARLLLRELRLSQACLLLDIDGPVAEPEDHRLFVRLLDRLDGVVAFVAAREPPPRLRAALRLDFARPAPTEQHAAWSAAMPEASLELVGRLAGQFRLDLADIHRIAGTFQGAGDAPRVWDAARQAARPEVAGLASRIDVRATRADLVLPPARHAQLAEITAQVEQQWRVYEEWGFGRRLNRGLGIAALFAGESGTGKTMAAEVIANAARLDLYRIDLASVISKYIGETEKNLRRVFDAFEDGGAILFFDEADALFGKRSEVKDSHDRYANIEINYLLQRIEAYRGLAILATNRRSSLDAAFLRRLRFIVNFPFPGPAERQQIWRRALQGTGSLERPAPAIDEIDFDRLAGFSLSGGNIQQAALNALFRAASEDAPRLEMAHVLGAVRAELQKLEVPFNEAAFQPNRPQGRLE